MAQEFYLKAQVLYEEFQKKELHYLNLEKKMHSGSMWIRDLNMPLQEYLQRINQREKETEETYRSILEQMEELDQHTNTLSLKLEKLGVLQASVTTSMTPNWFQRSDMGSNYPAVGMYSLPTRDAVSLSTKSASTQTENNLSCEKCHVLTKNQPSYVLENLSLSSPHLMVNNKTETMRSSNCQSDSSHLLNKTQNNSHCLESMCIEPKNVKFPETNIEIKHFEEKNSEQRFENEKISENKSSSYERQIHIDESVVDNTHHVLKNTEKESTSQSVVNGKIDQIKSPNGELYKETFVSKSDADSMNNEFDFLESSTSNVSAPTKRKMDQDVENIKSSANPADANSEARQTRERLHLGEKTLHPNSKLNATNEESEVSGSLSGFNSPQISVASDSDHIYEKESSLTASTAYQALLGNTIPLTRTPQKESGSESEDEVENALTSAVQRNPLKSKSSAKQVQNGTSHQSSSTKLQDKPAKVASSNRPQSKLSKNTRKVLGIDNDSSGSEVEIPGNSLQVKKEDEDSDEFGFYD